MTAIDRVMYRAYWLALRAARSRVVEFTEADLAWFRRPIGAS